MPENPARAPVSVVVPTRNRPDRLAACLTALLEDLHLAGANPDEIIVVDSASVDRSARSVAQAAGVRFIRSEVRGASLARNLGWRVATHRLVAFVDDDVLVQPGWAETIVGGFQSDIGRQFVTGAVHDPEDGEREGRTSALTAVSPTTHTSRSYGAIGGSGNLCVERSLLEAVGGFDERLGPGTWFTAAEDYDLFDRMLLSGASGHYLPNAAVIHDDGRDKMARLRLSWSYGLGLGGRLGRLAWTSPHRFRGVAKDLVWRGGVVMLVTQVRQRYEYGVASTGLHLLGMTAGFLAGLVVFAPPRRRTPGATT